MPEPVIVFLRHSLRLKAVMAECIDAPEPKPVHTLRSTTRRLEATLQLLILTADLPALPKRSKAFSSSLRKIRRVSGQVRDLDVHIDLLSAYKSLADADRLEKYLDSERRKKARKLQQRLLKDALEIQRTLDAIDATLAPTVDLNLSGGNLARAAQSWLATALRGLDLHSDDDLHSIRKSCKTARYIAEIGSTTSRAAHTLEKRFNDIQQTTGSWHDCLLLLDEAHRTLPNDSPLTLKLHAKAAQLRRLAETKAARVISP